MLIVLQPDMPAARLCAAGDDEARTMYHRISAVLLLMAVGRLLFQVLRAIQTVPDALASYQVIGAAGFGHGLLRRGIRGCG